MTQQASQVLADALALSEPDRARIAQELLETLAPSDASLLDDELEEELDRRLTEFQQDPTAAIPWSELKRELLE
jgi:putative addiction module component (TIGR02574 family)